MLPDGWIEKFSQTRQIVYYMHPGTGVTSWKHPANLNTAASAVFVATTNDPALEMPSQAPRLDALHAIAKRQREIEFSAVGRLETAEPVLKKPKTGKKGKPTDIILLEAGLKSSAQPKVVKEPALSKKSAKLSGTVKSPKPTLATASIATKEQCGVFRGSTMYNLGGGCAVLIFMNAQIQELLPEAVAYVSQKDVLKYDKKFMMMKECTRHRGEGFFSDEIDGYKFSKGEVTAQPLHPTLRALLDYVNSFVPNDPFTAVFVNHYRNKFDSIGKHSDKDVEPHEKVGVIAVSSGAERIVTFRPIDKNDTELKELHIATKHGQMLVMHGPKFQQKFSHAIVGKTLKAGDSAAQVHDADDGRFSFTFRRHHAAVKKSVVKPAKATKVATKLVSAK